MTSLWQRAITNAELTLRVGNGCVYKCTVRDDMDGVAWWGWVPVEMLWTSCGPRWVKSSNSLDFI